MVFLSGGLTSNGLVNQRIGDTGIVRKLPCQRAVPARQRLSAARAQKDVRGQEGFTPVRVQFSFHKANIPE